MGKMTRERLASMTDDELLAYERERHGNLYMTLTTAEELQKLDLKFWHMRALKEKAERETAAKPSTPTGLTIPQ
jgi:hypothetical protein